MEWLDYVLCQILPDEQYKRLYRKHWIEHLPTHALEDDYRMPFLSFFTMISKLHLHYLPSLLAQPEIISVLEKIIEEDDIYKQELLSKAVSLYYLPKQCHNLIKDLCNHLAENPNKFVRYNCHLGGNNPFGLIERYANQEQDIPQMVIDRMVVLGETNYIPRWLDIAKRSSLSQVKMLMDGTPYNFYDKIQYIRSLNNEDPFRKKWIQDHGTSPILRIFFIGNHTVCKKGLSEWAERWKNIPPERRCHAVCPEQLYTSRQCTSAAESVFGLCLDHITASSTIAMEPFTVKEEDIEYLNKYVTLPKDSILTGPYVIWMYYHKYKAAFELDQPHVLTIISSFPAPPPGEEIKDTILQEEIPVEIDTFGNPTIKKAWSYTQITRIWSQENELLERIQFKILWLQYRGGRSVVSLSAFNLDDSVFFDRITKLGYRFSKVVLPDRLSLQPAFQSEKLNARRSFPFFLYTIHRMHIYQSYLQTTVETTSWEKDFDLWINQSSWFGSTAEDVLLHIIDYNATVKTLGLMEFPLLLFGLPTPHNRMYKWSHVKIYILDQTYVNSLWRLYEGHSQFPSLTVSFFKWHDEPTLRVNNRWIDVNDVLKMNKPYLAEIAWESAKLPQTCFDLINLEDHTIFDFVEKESKDPPMVFFHRDKEKIQSACWRKSDLEQIYNNEESWFYECFQEGMAYASPERTYVKLSLFANYQIYITEWNFNALMQSKAIYFWISEKPFYHLEFSTKKSIADKTAEETPDDIELELGTYVGAYHCQAGSEASVYVIYPLKKTKRLL